MRLQLIFGIVAIFLFACTAVFPVNATDRIFVDSGQRIGIHPNIVVALGDLDGDGDVDAITPAYVSPITTWFNRGDGFFELGEDFGLSLSGNLQIADFDSDGDNDFFIINHSFSTTLYLNDGAGGFTDSGLNLGSACQHSADQGDVNGDGHIDVIVGCVGGWWNRPFLNDGAANLTPHGENILPSPRGLALGDLDGDGDLDAFAAIGESQSPDSDLVLFNDGTGIFTDSGQRLGDRHSNSVGLADFDNDGDLDAFVANNDFFGSDPANILWINDGAGNFTDSGQRIGADNSIDVDVADFDLDGDPDVLVINSVGPAQIWWNDGTGEFSPGPDLNLTRANIGRADVDDLDGDGDFDIYIIWPGGDRVLFNVLPADINLDGQVNLLDVAPFVGLLGSETFQAEADINSDGVVSLLDVAPFVELLIGG